MTNYKLNTLINKLRNDERGLSTVEYVVLLVLLVIMCAAVWNLFGNMLVEKLEASGTEFDQQVVTDSSGENQEISNTSAEFDVRGNLE